MKTIIIFLFTLFTQNVLACKVYSPQVINLASSLLDNEYFSYGAKSLLKEIPYAEISNCVQTAQQRKYLMIAFGPELQDSLDSYSTTNFNKDYQESTCKINNNPLSEIISSEFKKEIFNNKWDFINNCVEINITELGSRPLLLPPTQEGCEVTRISPKSISFKGGYCFIQPTLDSRFNVSLHISKKCSDYNLMKDSQTTLQELNASFAFYTSSTFTGTLAGMTAIGTFPARISINPIDQLFKASDDFGILRPRFPEQYILNDVHLGKIQFYSLDDENILIKTPLIASNICKSVHGIGLTSSLCNYATPLVAEISLYDQSKNEVFSWHDGGVMPSQWQGIISGEGYQISKSAIVADKKYSLKFKFNDQQLSYSYFKNLVNQKIGRINSRLPVITSSGEIQVISSIQELEELDDMMTVDPIVGLTFRDPLLGLANQRRRLNGYFSSTMWPPIYSKACNFERTKCINVSDNYLEFEAKFYLDENYEIKDLVIERKSKILANYKKTVIEQPEYICE